MRMRQDAGKFSASGDHYRVDKEIFVRFLNRGVKLLPKFLNENDFFFNLLANSERGVDQHTDWLIGTFNFKSSKLRYMSNIAKDKTFPKR